MYWQRTINGQTTQITTSTNTNKYSGSTVNTPSLTINTVAQSDTGSYRCLADNVIGTGQSQITVLNVAGSKCIYMLITWLDIHILIFYSTAIHLGWSFGGEVHSKDGCLEISTFAFIVTKFIVWYLYLVTEPKQMHNVIFKLEYCHFKWIASSYLNNVKIRLCWLECHNKQGQYMFFRYT